MDGESGTLRIRDDGVGFDPAGEASGRYGLIGMRERAGEIGAELTLDSNAADGTTVTVAWEAK